MAFLKYMLPALLVVVGLLLAVRLLRRRVMLELRERFRARNVIMHDGRSNFFGLESRGPGQIRGNGVLVLTDEELFFRMLLPSREIAIPLEQIRSVSTPRVHLGKSVGRKLLRVDFTDRSGKRDAAAWYVRELDMWVSALTGYSASPGPSSSSS